MRLLNSMGRAKSSRGGHLHQNRALQDHEQSSLPRKQSDRTSSHPINARSRHYRLAAACADSRASGFCFSERARRDFCGRLLLARLRQTLPHACEQSKILAGQDRAKRAARWRHAKDASRRGLESPANLGTRVKSQSPNGGCQSQRTPERPTLT